MFYRTLLFIFMGLASVSSFAEDEQAAPGRMSSAVYINPISVANNYAENKAQKDQQKDTATSELVNSDNKEKVIITAEPKNQTTSENNNNASLLSSIKLNFNWLYIIIAGIVLLLGLPLISTLRQRRELNNKIASFEKEITETKALTSSVQNKYEQIKNDLDAIKHQQEGNLKIQNQSQAEVQTFEKTAQPEAVPVALQQSNKQQSQNNAVEILQEQLIETAMPVEAEIAPEPVSKPIQPSIDEVIANALSVSENAATEQEHQQALDLWQGIIQLAPNQYPEAYLNAAFQACYLQDKSTDSAQQANYFAQSEQLFNQALALDARMYQAAYGLGTLYANRIRLLLALEREQEIGDLWQKAEKAYHKALEIKPEAYEVANNIGLLFSSQGRFLSTHSQLDEAGIAWQKSEAGYRAALAITPNNYTILYNLGNLLLNQAQLLLVQEQVDGVEDKWNQAEECYKQALSLNPEDYEIANNLGILLLNEAIFLVANQRIDEAEVKWQQVEQCYHRALTLKEDELQFILNLVYMYMHWYQARKASQPQVAAEKLALAKQLITQFVAKYPQHQVALAYDLACIESLTGNFEQSVEQLAICVSSGCLSSREQIEQDNDLQPVSNSDVFKRWVETAF